jgi:cytochrome b subunit of formate dehydrogenase
MRERSDVGWLQEGEEIIHKEGRKPRNRAVVRGRDSQAFVLQAAIVLLALIARSAQRPLLRRCQEET